MIKIVMLSAVVVNLLLHDPVNNVNQYKTRDLTTQEEIILVTDSTHNPGDTVLIVLEKPIKK